MKKLIFYALLSGTVLGLYAQNITISFQHQVGGTTIDSIWVKNLRTNEKVKLLGNETLTLTKVTGIHDLSFASEKGYLFPNPCNGKAQLSFTTVLNQDVKVNVYNISGQLLNTESQFLYSGEHRFNVIFPQAGIYTVSILKDDGSMSFKAVCLGIGITRCKIDYLGSEYQNPLKSAIAGKTLSYTQGDIFHYSAFSDRNNTIITDSPTVSKIYSVEFYKCIDPDNTSYPIVKIGNQWWMAKNLQTTKYNDGTSIPNVTDNSAWDALTTDAYCWYNNDALSYRNLYGALYDYYAVNTGKLCPSGWQVPSDAEWTTLTTFLGGEYVAGDKMKETGTVHWVSPNTGATNESGFSGLPGGTRGGSDGAFGLIGYYGIWWSSTEPSTEFAWFRNLGYSYTSVYRSSSNKDYGFSIRCLRDY